jgi:hypothetical protein
VIGALLEDSLALWQVPGAVEEEGEAVVVRAAGREIRVLRGRASRWAVCVDGGGGRPCASIVGVLSTVREQVDVAGGAALRIAPALSAA